MLQLKNLEWRAFKVGEKAKNQNDLVKAIGNILWSQSLIEESLPAEAKD